MKKTLYYALIGWILGASFFFVEYIARVSSSVMIDPIMIQYQLTAVGVGALSAFFYYAYVGMQIPVGLLVDHYGPHRLLAIMAALCAFGCFLFAYASDVVYGQIARFIMGFGGAFAFVGTLKLAMMWLPAKHFGFIAGLTQAVGMFGASFGEGPLKAIVDKVGWENTMLGIAGLLTLLAILIAWLVKDRRDLMPKKNINEAGKQHLYALKEVLSSKTTWKNACFLGLLYAPTGAFGELWGVSYLHHTQGVTEKFAAYSISMLFIGLGIAGPIAGWLSDRLKTRVHIMRISAFFSLLTLCTLLYVPLPKASIPVLCLLYGISNTGLCVAYAFASELHSKDIGGTSLAFANMASVILASVFQPLLGFLLDFYWSGQLHGSTRIYTASDYHSAMFLLPICLVLSFTVSLFLSDSMAQRKL